MRQTATQKVLERLRNAIVSGERLPGERLVQEQIAGAYGVSRIPVREALHALQADGLAEYERNSGYTVARIDAEQLHHIQRLRQLLEAEAVGQAGAQGTLAAAAVDMAAALAAIEATPLSKPDEIAARTRAFHFCLFESCGNEVLLKILRNLWDATDNWRMIYYRLVFVTDAEHRAAVGAEHAALVACVAAGAVGQVVERLDRLRDHGIAMVKAAVRHGDAEKNQVRAHLMLQALGQVER